MTASRSALLENTDQEFHLLWPGRAEAFQAYAVDPGCTLVPDPNSSLHMSESKHMIIEGDNLFALHALRKDFFGSIKVIYIDPPYNTGKHFVYSDVFQYESKAGSHVLNSALSKNRSLSGKKHAKWLSMMFPRLLLARDLLKDNGVLFVSIDDNEIHHLKMLLNEIFGEENFVSQLVVTRSNNGIGDKKGFSLNHDYVLIYQKTDQAQFFGLPITESEAETYKKADEFGRYRIDGLLRKKGAASRQTDRPNLFFPLYFDPKNGKVSVDPVEGYAVTIPICEDGSNGRWMWSMQKCRSDAHLLHAGKKGTIYIKTYAKPDKKRKMKTVTTNTLYYTDRATKEIKDLMGEKVFETAKPVQLIKDLISTVSDGDDVILDFFAGSGTTGQAVLELNSEDGHNRSYILVESDEIVQISSTAFKLGYGSIASITRERIIRHCKRPKSELETKEAQNISFKAYIVSKELNF
jgi:adenine-specific DNA-methyltransferase